MNAHYPSHPSGESTLTRDQAAELLRRYPRVSDGEAKAIVTFLRKGRHLDVGMLTADERLKPQLDGFMADHGKHLRVGAGEATVLIAAIAGLFFALSLIWEAIKPGTI
jgi:hypothetical protein